MAKFFRRYKSTIYGNYRRAYLMYGAATGVAMAVVVALRNWMGGAPMSTPENYITELVLAAGIVWATWRYRKGLPDGRVTLKELMLLGLGIGVVSGVLYGLWTWLHCGVLDSSLTEHYNDCRIAVMDDPGSSPEARIAVEQVKKYTAGDWAFIAGFRTAVISIIITFFSALIFRTEKGEIVSHSKKETKQ